MSIAGEAAPYLKIADDLRRTITEGPRRPGDKLPSQHELSQHYGVARATVQAALRVLAAQGLITSKQGAGHYVTDRPPGASAVDLSICPARIELDRAQLAWLAALPMPAHSLNRLLYCRLDLAHSGPHADLGQHSGDTEWWVLWTLAAMEINAIAACPVLRDPAAEGSGDLDEDDNICMHFAGHPGRHAYGSGGRQ